MHDKDLALAQNGDPAAFERLVTPHLKGLYGFLARRTGDLAEDVYQETLLGAWRSIRGFGANASFKTWLYAIAGNRSMDALRKRARQPQTGELDEQLGQAGFEEAAARAMDIRESLGKLHSEDQTLLYLVYTQGLSLKDAAAILGIPEGTVKSRLHRLRQTLKTQLGGEPHGT